MRHLFLNFSICHKILFFFFLLFFTGVQQSFPQSPGPQLLFDRGNDQFQEGNYQEALSTYRLLEQQNRVSGALFLNMGISYIQVDSLGKAKYYFMKASRYDETRSKATEALEYVESQFSRQSAVLPKLPWERVIDWLRVHVGATTLLGISILLVNLGIGGFVATWFFTPRFDQIIRKTGLGLAGTGIILLLLSFYVQYIDQRYSDAVMVHNRSNVLEQPSPDAPVVNQAYEGYTFTVDHYQSESHSDWSYVRMSNGLYGWIATDDILIL